MPETPKPLAVRRRAALAAALALACAIAAGGLSACGGSPRPEPGERTASEARAGGMATVLLGRFPESLDPQLAVGVNATEALAQVYPGLVTFRHRSGEDGTEVVPGLAEALPDRSDGGRTYAFRLREGLVYSDGSPVKASDFAATARRLLDEDSPAAGLGWLAIEGAKAYSEQRADDIEGIVTDDRKRSIEITLVEPRSSFLHELALPSASPVPAGTPPGDRSAAPPPGTGRYVIDDVVMGRSVKLVQNPSFSPALEGTAVDEGGVVTVSVEVEPDPARAAARVASGRADLMVDVPPGGRLRARFGDRLRTFEAPGAGSIVLDPGRAPFDDPRVREAVALALEPRVLDRRQAGPGRVLGRGVLRPPVAVAERPQQRELRLARARRLVDLAGARELRVAVAGPDDAHARRTTEYFAGLLDSIGLEGRATVDGDEDGTAEDAAPAAAARWGGALRATGTTLLSARLDAAACRPEHRVWVHDWSRLCLR